MTVTEVFADSPVTTVPAGASGTLSSGQADTWNVFSSAGFPTAATGISQFHIADPAAPSELVLVTNMTGGGNNTWSVIRGADSTTPVAHAAGFTVTNVISAGWLNTVAAGLTFPLTVGEGGTGGTAVTAYSVLAGGTTATSPVQAVTAGAGSIGYVLTTNGTNALPSWQVPTGGTSLSNPMSSVGDMITGGASGIPARVPGGTVAIKQFLTQTGTGSASAAPVWGTIASADVPVLNQNTSGTAAAVSGTVAIVNGGTGQGTQQAALNAIAGGTTGGYYLRGTGSNVTLSALQAADLTGVVSVIHGGTGDNTATSYAVVTGGTASTAPFQQVSGLGTAGQLLTSNGTGALPSWQAAGNTTGTAGGLATITPSGDTSGGTDWANINAALTAAAQGQPVVLGAGTYWVDAPIVLPSSTGVDLRGQEGAMQGGAGSPGVGVTIRPTASFASSFTTGTGGSTPIWSVIIGGAGSRVNIQDLWIYGASLPSTTAGTASSGGTISGIASWSSPSAGVLSVASTNGFNASGTLAVQASGANAATVTYSGTTATTFTGCAYVTGSASGTVSTGGVVDTPCDGINFYSSHGGHSIYRVGINNMTGWGVYIRNQSGSGGSPLGIYGDTLIIQDCGAGPLGTELVGYEGISGATGGGYYCGGTDCYHHNVHAQNNIGIQIATGSGDNRLVGCRGDGDNVTGSTIGFGLSADGGNGGLGIGVIMIGCSTGANNLQAVVCAGGGQGTYGPYQIIGCSFNGDGQNGGSGGLGAIHCIGRVDVGIIGTNISCDSTGSWPAYALTTARNSPSAGVPDIVQAGGGGLWQAATAFVNDAAPATLLDIDSSIQGFIGPQDGTAGTTTFQVVTPAPVRQGGTGGTAVTAYAVVAGGTSATSPLQHVSGLGASGQILTSQGAGSLPTWTTAGAPAVNSITTSGTNTYTLAAATYGAFNVTLGASSVPTFDFTGLSAGSDIQFTVVFTQPVLGGVTVAWGTAITWIGGTTPELNTSTNAVSVFVFQSVDGTTWLGSMVTGPTFNGAATSQVSISPSAGESVVSYATIPANLAAGATYRITAWGTIATLTTSGTSIMKTRLGGLSGTQVQTLTSASLTSSNTYNWRSVADVTLQTAGTAGVWCGDLQAAQNIQGAAASTYLASSGTVTADSTTAQVFAVTLNLSGTASTASCMGSTWERVA